MTGALPNSSPSPEPRRTNSVNGWLVWHAVRRHPITFLGILLLTTGAGFGFWYFLALPRSTGAVVYHISSRTPSVLDGAGQNTNDILPYRQAQAAQFKKRTVLSRALSAPEVHELSIVRNATPDDITWLDKELKVDFKLGSEFMRVILEADEPDEIKVVMRSLDKVFRAEVDEKENGARRRRLTALEDFRLKYDNALKSFNTRIDAIAKSLGTIDLPGSVAVGAMLNDDLSHARHELAAIRSLLSQAGVVVGPEDVEAPPLPAVEPKVLAPLLDDLVINDPGVRQIEAEIAQWKENIAKIEAAVQPGVEPLPLVRARDALKTTQVRLEKTKADLRPRLEATAKRLALADAAKKAELQKDFVANLKRRELATRTQVNDLLVSITEKSVYRSDLVTLQKKIQTNEKLSDDLSVTIERLKMDLDAPLRVSVAEEPYIMTGLEANKRLKVTLMGTIGVFVVSFAGLVFWEFRTRRVTNADEVSRALGIRLVGTVPPISSLANTSGRGQAESHAFAEAIDAARTMLLYGCAGGSRLRTVLVTSALAGEGKTSLAGHLAISLTRAGYKTLLVDGDLWAPAAHNLFDIPPTPGLSEVLRGDLDVRETIHASPLPGLSVLPAGTWDLSVRQALAGDRWRNLRQELEALFDFIIVDSAPALLVSDSLLLARDADGVLLSVLLDVSRVSTVAETQERLQSVGANVIGVIVNGVATQSYRSPYYSEYGRASTNGPVVVGAAAQPVASA